MTAPAAMQADYCDLRFIKGRKVIQVVLELPIEAGAQFVSMFGTPDPSKTIPVAVARIDKSVADKPKGGPLCKRAAILCNEGAFQAFIDSRTNYTIEAFDMSIADKTAAKLRFWLNIKSRTELDHDHVAAEKFKDIVASYEAWKLV